MLAAFASLVALGADIEIRGDPSSGAAPRTTFMNDNGDLLAQVSANGTTLNIDTFIDTAAGGDVLVNGISISALEERVRALEPLAVRMIALETAVYVPVAPPPSPAAPPPAPPNLCAFNLNTASGWNQPGNNVQWDYYATWGAVGFTRTTNNHFTLSLGGDTYVASFELNGYYNEGQSATSRSACAEQTWTGTSSTGASWSSGTVDTSGTDWPSGQLGTWVTVTVDATLSSITKASQTAGDCYTAIRNLQTTCTSG